MNLIKTSLLNSLAVVIKTLTKLILNKLLAVWVGPSGYGSIGQFQNSIQMLTTFASGAINTGVVKYTAEYKDFEEKQRVLWRTAGSIVLIGTFFVSVTILISNKKLALFFLNDEKYGTVYIWLAVMLGFFVFNTLFLAILNGKKEVVKYVSANIAGSIFSLAITVVLASKLGLYGALLSLAVYQSLSFFVTSILMIKAKWFKISYLIGGIDLEVTKKLLKFTLMSLVSAVCVPLSNILVRSHLTDSFGLVASGYWEAMYRFSNTYLMFITTTLSVYYLPRLSELIKYEDIKKELLQGYRIIFPVVIALAAAIYLFRFQIINLLFSSEFEAIQILFPFQLLGDVFKIGSWLLSYLMIGKAMAKLFIIFELSFSLSFYILTIVLTNFFGLNGVSLAHCINYLLYWIVVAFFVLKKINTNKVNVIKQNARRSGV